MFLWFVGMSVLAVWAIFQSPAIDYRFIVVGSVLPVVEVLFGRPMILHTLVGAVGALALVMVVTRGRRLVRRRWLGIPIGMMLHLALDGSWADKQLFWWPVYGGLPDRGVPEVRDLSTVLVLEAFGLAALVWMWKRKVIDVSAIRPRPSGKPRSG